MQKSYIAFGGLCLGFFIIMMDTTTVPLIYTTLMDEFQVSPVDVAWVNNSYLVTYAAFLLLGGRLGDSINRKNLVLSALVALCAGAALSGSGQDLGTVIAGRALMGGGGAGLLTPQSMAFISIIFAKGGRGTALGIWGTVAGIATATGPVVTQTFLAFDNWRWVMWVNIPVGIVCFLVLAASLPSALGQGIKVKELLISGLYGLCLAGVIVGIQLFSANDTQASIGVVLCIAGALFAATLVRTELKQKSENILSAELWSDGIFLRICLISGLLGFSLTGFYLPLAFLLDVRLSFGPVAISISMITIALANAVVGPFAGNFSDRMTPEIIIRLGLAFFAAACLALGIIGYVGIEGRTFALVATCVAMAIAGTGTGLAFAPLANLALSRAPMASIGRAAAFFNSVRQVLSALGSVIVAIVFDRVIRVQLEQDMDVTVEALRSSPLLTAEALGITFAVLAVSLFCGAVLSRRKKETVVVAELQ